MGNVNSPVSPRSEDTSLEFPYVYRDEDNAQYSLPIRSAQVTASVSNHEPVVNGSIGPEQVVNGTEFQGLTFDEPLQDDPEASHLNASHPNIGIKPLGKVFRGLKMLPRGGWEEIETTSTDDSLSSNQLPLSVTREVSCPLTDHNFDLSGSCKTVNPALLVKSAANQGSILFEPKERLPTTQYFGASASEPFETIVPAKVSPNDGSLLGKNKNVTLDQQETILNSRMTTRVGELQDFGDILAETTVENVNSKRAAELEKRELVLFRGNTYTRETDPNIPRGWQDNIFDAYPYGGLMVPYQAQKDVEKFFDHSWSADERVSSESLGQPAIKHKTNTSSEATPSPCYSANCQGASDGKQIPSSKRTFASTMTAAERAEDDARPGREKLERAEKRRRIAQAPIRVDGFPEGNVPLPLRVWEDNQTALVHEYPNHLYGDTLKRLVEEFGWTARNLADQAGGGGKITRNAMGKRVAKVMGRWKVVVKNNGKGGSKPKKPVGKERG